MLANEACGEPRGENNGWDRASCGCSLHTGLGGAVRTVGIARDLAHSQAAADVLGSRNGLCDVVAAEGTAPPVTGLPSSTVGCIERQSMAAAAEGPLTLLSCSRGDAAPSVLSLPF